MKKISVLNLITALNYGGAEKVVFDLVKNADRNKFCVKVACLGTGDMLPLFVRNGMSPLVCNMNKNYRGLINVIKLVNKFVRKNEIDIIHAHMFHSLFIASIVKIFSPNIKIVFTPHNVNLEHKLREIITFLLRPFRSMDILFSVIEKRRYYNSNIRVIPNGIEIDTPVNRNAKGKDQEFEFICVGGFRPQKNYLQFLKEVVPKINENYKFKVLIAGKGELQNEIEKSINDNGIEDKIHLLGLRNDIPELLNNSDAFLMPSKWEGFPIAILEAGERQLPIIATPVGSVPSILEGNCGFLSSVEQFATNMEYIMDNHQEALRRGMNLREKIVSEFSIESVVRKHEALYTQILDS